VTPTDAMSRDADADDDADGDATRDKRAREDVADAGADDAKRARADASAGGAAADENATTTTTTTTTTGAVALAGASGGTAMVQGVPEQWDDGAFAAWLTELGCRRVSSKKRRRWTYGFVTFGEVGDRIEATTAMERVEFRGRCVRVKQAKAKGKTGVASTDGSTDASALIERANANARRDIRDVITPLWNVSYGEQLARKKEIVAEAMRNITRGVRNASNKARKSGRRADVGWMRAALGNDKLCCELGGIVRSPVLDGYRNKSEFTIGPSANGEITCGFNVGSFRDGVTAVAPPTGCRNISDTAKYLGDATQTYLRARAADGKGLPVYDKRKATGFWRLFLCREAGTAPASEHGWKHWLRTGAGPPKPSAGTDGEIKDPDATDRVAFTYPDEEFSLPSPSGEHSDKHEVLVMFQVCTRGYTDEQVKEECDGVLAAVEEAVAKSAKPINLKTCLVQFWDGVSNVAPDDAEIKNLRTNAPSEKSADIIHEHMCGLQFSLSATAFFQVNTVAAEALYRLAGEWASPGGQSLLLDVCCGTGTIGLTLARAVKKVVGVDIVEESIRDAFTNAKLNGVDNTDWLAGKAEHVLPKVLNDYKTLIRPDGRAPKPFTAVSVLDDPDLSADEETEAIVEAKETTNAELVGANHEFDDVVAIVDPPRAGLHRHVLSALRRENRLKRLVYVSCNANTMATNVIDLCVPQGADGNGGGVPFTPVKALALDLFPHTAHVEAVLLLER
jgi:tRNA (uracil-5-)-methyltransferase